MGRAKGSEQKKLRYKLFLFNNKLKIWEEDGEYTSTLKIGEKLGLKKQCVSRILSGKNKFLSKMYKIEKIN